MSEQMQEMDLRKVPDQSWIEVDLEDLFKRPWFAEHQRCYWGVTVVKPENNPTKRYWKRSSQTFSIDLKSTAEVTRALYLDHVRKARLSYSNTPIKYLDAFVKARPIDLATVPFEAMFQTSTHSVANSGWDPEIFVESADSEIIPAFEFLPGKKSPTSTGGGTAYYDGFGAEFTTAAGSCHESGMDNVRKGLQTVLHSAARKFPKSKLSLKNVYTIPDRFLLQAKDEHVALGCNPSLNAYGKASFFTDMPRSLPYRVAGGHVHFQIAKLTDEKAANVIKAMDLLVGIPSVAIFEGIDDPLRREYYGRAGEYRKPSYGIEYRTLSNAWLGDPRVAHLIMGLARLSTGYGEFPGLIAGFGTTSEQVQEIINFCDVKGARALVTKNIELYKDILHSYWPQDAQDKKFIQIVNDGALSMFPNYRDIPLNWEFGKHWENYNDGHRVNWRKYCAGTSYANH